MKNIEIQVWRAEDKLARWNELWEVWYPFWIHEPLNSALTRLAEEESKKPLRDMLKDSLSYDGTPCIVAWDTEKQKAAGMVLCMTWYPEHKIPPELAGKDIIGFAKYSFDPEVVKKLTALESFLEDMFTKADVFNKYGVGKVLAIHITSVSQEYTRQGIANEMTAKVLEIAKEDGFQLVVSESTSAFTQRNKINRFNFEKVLEMDYENNYAHFHLMPANTKESHKTAAVLVKRL